jgi:hypothetical protein
MGQGIRTSANEVYVLDLKMDNNVTIEARSEFLSEEVVLDSDSVFYFLQGREIKSYRLQPSGKVVIMPYRVEGSRAKLIPEDEFEQRFPKTYRYLLRNKKFLENRENGRHRGLQWYGYGRVQNIDLMLVPKILVPDIADRACFAIDENGEYAFTSGYGITLKYTVSESSKYILGLLKSRVLDFYLKKVSTPLRGGFFRYFTQFIEQLPIRSIDFSETSDRVRHDRIVQLVEQMLSLHRQLTAAKTPQDQTVFQRQIDATDRQIDQLVYELYGLSDAEIKIVEAAIS